MVAVYSSLKLLPLFSIFHLRLNAFFKKFQLFNYDHQVPDPFCVRLGCVVASTMSKLIFATSCKQSFRNWETGRSFPSFCSRFRHYITRFRCQHCLPFGLCRLDSVIFRVFSKVFCSGFSWWTLPRVRWWRISCYKWLNRLLKSFSSWAELQGCTVHLQGTTRFHYRLISSPRAWSRCYIWPIGQDFDPYGMFYIATKVFWSNCLENWPLIVEEIDFV